MSLTLKNRTRLLSLAKMLDRWALRIRKYVRQQTPRRPRKAQENAV